jgi:hypothetical protein
MPLPTTAQRAELMRDVLTTAVEGGITYWCNEPADDGTLQVERIERLPDLSIERIVFNVAAVEAVSGASVRNGFANGARTTNLTITVEASAMLRALRAITEGKVTFGGQPLQANSTMRKLASSLLFATPDDAPDYDAGDADNLLQAALFGDVVYG